MECSICAEKCNKVRKEVTCTCGFKACSKCIKTYILSSSRFPGCMNCNCEWTDDFIIKNLTYTFYSKDMANKVKSLIIEEEKALIPNDMEEAQRIKVRNNRINKSEKYRVRSTIAWNAYCSVIINLESTKHGLFNSRKYHIVDDDPEIITTFYRYDRLLIRLTDEYISANFNKKVSKVKEDVKLKCQLWKKIYQYYKSGKIIELSKSILNKGYELKLDRMLEELEEYYIQYYIDNHKSYKLRNDRVPFNRTGIKPKENKFIMKCTKEGCNSLISTRYKCEMCNTYTCKDCHLNIGNIDEKKSHVCDEDLVKTVALIKKETKPCPKCSINITKIIGCSQMFCTNCNTKFNWNTLEIITRGAFHNPHYTEYKSKGGRSFREAGDIVCGGVPYPNLQNGELYGGEIEKLRQVSDLIAHIRTHTMLRLPTENLTKLREIRIKYIIGEYDETKWMSEVFRIRKKCSFNRNMYQILDMITNCSVFIMRNFINDNSDMIIDNYLEQKIELINLIKYGKEQVDNLCKIYKFSNSGYLDIKESIKRWMQ